MLVRRGNRVYCYKARREAGRVLRIYVGAGLAAEEAYAEEQARRQARLGEQAACQADQVRLAPADSLLQTFNDQVELIVKASLITAGYYQHHRSEWRKRRHERNSEQA